tara:strand:+ start:13757 stop:13951 length:195 start_codon:yes stop_codon:yes gene_type:complete
MSNLIESYKNKSGETVLEIFFTGRSYRFNGKGNLGAGCGSTLDEVKNRIFGSLTKRQLNKIIKV